MFSFFKRFTRSQGEPAPAEKRDDTPSPATPQAEADVPDAFSSPVSAPVATTPAAPAPVTLTEPVIEPVIEQEAEQVVQPVEASPPPHPAPAAPVIAETPAAPSPITSPVTPPAAPERLAPTPPQAVAPPLAPSPAPVLSQPPSPVAAPVVAPAPPAAPEPIVAPVVVTPTPPKVMPALPSLHPKAAPKIEEAFEIVPPPEPEPAARQSWLKRLRSGLSKTSSGLTGLFIGVKVDEDLFEELETALLVSDAGVDATEFLLTALRQKVRAERLTDGLQVKQALRALLIELLAPLERSMVLGRAQPLVIMMTGVNGAGKTTSIGKLAKHLQSYGQSVLLAAGDTFRAAAREQLVIWGQRNNVTVVEQAGGDPAAVIFDAVNAARARKIDIMMADTAGRLPTQLHLMEELRKVKRVVGKAFEGAPHEVLLVIDANTGQNALSQVKAFDDALGLTGLIVTKLDGTAKGGILAAIARQRPIPVYFIGVGEGVDDLQPFSATEFADALLG